MPVMYLDNAATTPVFESSLRAAWPWLTAEFGNPSSTHELGLRAKAALEAARDSVAQCIAARPSEVIFTSGATEANNLAIKGIALANPRGRHIVSAKTEHSSVLASIEYLVRNHGFEITWLAVDFEGRINLDQLIAAIRPDTTLVALMWVNNESGVVHPMQEIARICTGAGVPLHCDAVQAVGHFDTNMHDYEFASMVLAGHKIGAPKGVGALFLRSGTPFESTMNGGGQEFELRSGTQNVAWAVAFAAALDHSSLRGSQHAAVGDLAGETSAFIREVLSAVPNARLVGPALDASSTRNSQRTPAIASFVFEGLNGETILLELEERGIICSSGSACSAGSTEPSHVLTAMGYSEDLARTAVRFSFAHQLEATATTAELEPFSAEKVVNALVEITGKLRGKLNA